MPTSLDMEMSAACEAVGLPTIPQRPTRRDALAALDVLEALLTEFPFSEPASHSVALSALITTVIRGALSVAPLHAISAPVAGSGKTDDFHAKQKRWSVKGAT